MGNEEEEEDNERRPDEECFGARAATFNCFTAAASRFRESQVVLDVVLTAAVAAAVVAVVEGAVDDEAAGFSVALPTVGVDGVLGVEGVGDADEGSASGDFARARVGLVESEPADDRAAAGLMVE